MYEAMVGSLGKAVAADVYETYSAPERSSYADSLTCTGCAQPAYFIRRARNGRAACFGARPHLDGCEMASMSSEDGGSASLPVDEPRLTSKDEFVLRPIDARGVRHVVHDPRRSETDGTARRYTGRGIGGESRPSMGLSVLLRRLVREPEFRESKAKLVLPDDTRGTIRKYCVEVIDADLRLANRRRLYWGTIRYANDDGSGGVWLNLGRRGAPALHLKAEVVAELLDRHQIEEIEELQGAAFMGYLYLKKARASDRMFLFPEDLEWFALRLPDEDPI